MEITLKMYVTPNFDYSVGIYTIKHVMIIIISLKIDICHINSRALLKGCFNTYYGHIALYPVNAQYE